MPYAVTLSPSDLEFGRQLTAELKKRGFSYRGVLWLFDEASDDWQLVVATEMVDGLGPRNTYLALSKITKSMQTSDFQLLRLSVMSPRNPIYAALRSVFGSAQSVEGARLQNTMVNGLSVTAYLYEIS